MFYKYFPRQEYHNWRTIELKNDTMNTIFFQEQIV